MFGLILSPLQRSARTPVALVCSVPSKRHVFIMRFGFPGMRGEAMRRLSWIAVSSSVGCSPGATSRGVGETFEVPFVGTGATERRGAAR